MYKMLSRVSHEKVTRFFTCLCLVSLIASIQFWGVPVYIFRFLRTIQHDALFLNLLILSTIKTSLFSHGHQYFFAESLAIQKIQFLVK